jgi:hypothetical protein
MLMLVWIRQPNGNYQGCSILKERFGDLVRGRYFLGYGEVPHPMADLVFEYPGDARSDVLECYGSFDRLRAKVW